MLDALIYSSSALGSIVSNRIEVSSLPNSLIVSFADCAHKSGGSSRTLGLLAGRLLVYQGGNNDISSG